jgi:hypothetical protein
LFLAELDLRFNEKPEVLTEFLGGTRSQIDFLEKLEVMIDLLAEQEVKTLFLVEPGDCTIKYCGPIM